MMKHCQCTRSARKCPNCGGMTFADFHSFLKELRQANMLRVPDFHAGDLDDWSPAERSNELAGETGELCNELKKLLRFQKSSGIYEGRQAMLAAGDVQELKIEQELADVIICADLIGAQLGIDLEKVVRAKFNATSDQIGSKVKL